ncbi:MAG: hydrolase [Ruminococcus sp.]|jgi:nicotinamidase-related amidase|nr:hydrolase [Ruminococcus sp.]
MKTSYKSLLNPNDCAILLIDHEPQMFFGVESTSRATILNNVTALAKTAKIFSMPIILSTVEAKEFSGPLVKKVQNVYPDITPIDRTSLDAWEDANFKRAVEATGRKKLIIAGLWTEVCVALPTLAAIEDGYDVFIVTDASAGASLEAHNMAIQRCIQAGAHPVTWMQVCLELQRDWANKVTYTAVTTMLQEHAGAYGLGLEYATAMIPKAAQSAQQAQQQARKAS